jgi:aminoglycoside phosphotransferase (APT) family kinase protein
MGPGLLSPSRPAVRGALMKLLPPGERVIDLRRLTGATTATVAAARVEAPDGARRSLVLRWYDDPGFLEVEPEAVDREAAVLRSLAPTAVPAPRLIAARAEAPAAVLMTRLDGRIRFDLPDPGAMRAILDAIHATSTEGLARWRYTGYHEGRRLTPPGWWRDRRLWERAVRQTETARPVGPQVVLHRDFHPGNVLWTGRRITGIVDWVNACVGPAEFDAAHFRVNLAALHGVAGIDALVPGDPAWDIEAAFGFLDWSDPSANEPWAGPWPHVPATVARERLEAFVARAIAALG